MRQSFFITEDIEFIEGFIKRDNRYQSHFSLVRLTRTGKKDMYGPGMRGTGWQFAENPLYGYGEEEMTAAVASVKAEVVSDTNYELYIGETLYALTLRPEPKGEVFNALRQPIHVPNHDFALWHDGELSRDSLLTLGEIYPKVKHCGTRLLAQHLATSNEPLYWTLMNISGDFACVALDRDALVAFGSEKNPIYCRTEPFCLSSVESKVFFKMQPGIVYTTDEDDDVGGLGLHESGMPSFLGVSA